MTKSTSERATSRREILRAASATGGAVVLSGLSSATSSTEVMTVEAAGRGSASDLSHAQLDVSSTAAAESRLAAYSEPGLPSALMDAFARFVEAQVPSIVLTRAEPLADASDLYLGTSPPEGHETHALGRVHWIPIVHFSRFERVVATEALRDVFSGRRRDWSALGSSSGQLELVLDRASVLPIARAIGVAVPRLPRPSGNPTRPREGTWISHVRLLDSPRQVVDYVSANVEALGFVALGDLSFEVRPLSVSGGDATAGGDDWPIQNGISLSVRPDTLPADKVASLVGSLRAGLPALPTRTRLTAVGDVMLGRRTDMKMVAYGDYTRPFHDVAGELGSADVAVANLEGGPLSDRAKPLHVRDILTFVTPTKAIAGLTFAGFDAVSLANNHILNVGTPALLDTLRVLGSAGIKHFGGGASYQEAHRPALVERNGLRFAFLGYDDIRSYQYAAGSDRPGTAALELRTVVSDIKAARKQADVVVPFFHWGVEYQLYPTSRQREVAAAAVEAGAGLVLGSHPHWVQTIEFYKGVLIAYSLGNFVFDYEFDVQPRRGIILKTIWRGATLASFDVLPVQIFDLHQPRILSVDGGAGREIVQRLVDASPTNFRRKG